MADFHEGDIVTHLDQDLGEGTVLAVFEFEVRIRFGDAVHWVAIDRLRFERRPELPNSTTGEK